MAASDYELPFKPETVDVVSCFNVLEHLRDPELCIKEMLRVVKEDGTLGLRSKIVERLSTLPLFGNVGGGVFIVGKFTTAGRNPAGDGH